jgi:hypothetical protein
MLFDSCHVPKFRGLRRGDRQDAREFFENFGASLTAIAKRHGPKAALDVKIEVPGLINGPERVYATSRVIEESPGLINGPAQTRHPTFVTAPTTGNPCGDEPGDSAHKTDPDCPPRRNCGDDALPFNSRKAAGFPIIGNGAFAEATLTVEPKVQEVIPYEVYWAAFDVANGYARINIAELVSAKIGTEEQLLGPGMVASVFIDVKEKMPVTWKSFTPSLGLELTFGHPLANTVHMGVWGVLWAEVKRR